MLRLKRFVGPLWTSLCSRTCCSCSGLWDEVRLLCAPEHIATLLRSSLQLRVRLWPCYAAYTYTYNCCNSRIHYKPLQVPVLNLDITDPDFSFIRILSSTRVLVCVRRDFGIFCIGLTVSCHCKFLCFFTSYWISSCQNNVSLVRQCQKALNDISTRHAVGLYWVPWTCRSERKWNRWQARKWRFCSTVCWTWAFLGDCRQNIRRKMKRWMENRI